MMSNLLEFIVVKTYPKGIPSGQNRHVGRYVADLFYHPTLKQKEDVYSEGFFLNAQLLEEKLADLSA